MSKPGVKSWRKALLWGLGAPFIGAGIVLAFVTLLSHYGPLPDQSLPLAAARSSITFPESQKDLDALSAQLARKGAALSGIEPAAGEPSKK
jgi:hypothetical protein